ncbi:hypothetical protein TH53_01120 [Pedobacter lusitanus]|uniref:GP-PDE domain-containing protein n=1 Tax=Pedobacter lusitanus TaxID=1503925 RepID=A0A0D0GRA5_9SPHI|nr:glycerophosphodiester phosphodiesterase family protein [Pedobacter lusitanus]KIO78735.1 hypothetical protein TH53_01120 [Pedobacter lusitanus]
MKNFLLKITVLAIIPVALSSCASLRQHSTQTKSPQIVAHRGGKNDFPENTLLAFNNALQKGADAVEMDIQVSKDSVPVLYHPNDLSVWTDGKGKIENFTLKELNKLNAAWNYQPDKGFPYRKLPLHIPTLREALNTIPSDIPITLDMKSLPPGILVRSIARVLDELNAWNRVIFYSTSIAHLNALKAWPKARVFEARELTRQRLLDYRINRKYQAPDTSVTWIGFELQRSFTINEALTLGEGSSPVTIDLWDKELIRTIKGKSGKIKIILFGINNEQDYQKAGELGADAVLTDAPANLTNIRAKMK